MFDTREKRERALGTKLLLKGHRCQSPKCASIRRPARPGVHGKRRRMLSEFGGQLQEKQKLQFSYGLREAQLARIFKEAVRRQGATGEVMLGFLERRLDNTLFRLGLAPSRSVGRQLVGHGHITVNGRKVSIPSYRIRVGDVIAIREQSREHPVFKDLGEALKNYTPPSWLLMDEVKLEGTVKALPHEFDTNIDVNMVVDYYSQ